MDSEACERKPCREAALKRRHLQPFRPWMTSERQTYVSPGSRRGWRRCFSKKKIPRPDVASDRGIETTNAILSEASVHYEQLPTLWLQASVRIDEAAPANRLSRIEAPW